MTTAEYVPPKLIIALDPGGTTGIATCRMAGAALSERSRWDRYQVEDCDKASQLRSLLQQVGYMAMSAGSPIHIIYEPFEFRRNDRERDKIEYTSAEVVGALKYWACDLDYVKLVPSTASSGMTFWDDDKIKKLGLWVPGHRHAMDATSHLLKYRSFTLGEKNLFLPFKPMDARDVRDYVDEAMPMPPRSVPFETLPDNIVDD
jgi:hypothetical protein